MLGEKQENSLGASLPEHLLVGCLGADAGAKKVFESKATAGFKTTAWTIIQFGRANPNNLMRKLFLLLFCGLLGQQLTAQTMPEISTTADEVIVTGSRLPKRVAESAQRVTVIDSAAVARSSDLSQLLNEQAGIVINGAYSNPGKDRSIFLRNGANQYTLILVDGQPLVDPSSLGGAVDLRLLDMEGIERIEILRGARSLLYGSDAVAGVINLITKKNTGTKSPTLHLRAAGQSYNTLETGATVSGGLEKLDYRASISYFDTDGISEAEEPASQTGEFGKDGATRFGAGLSLNYRPNENLSIRPALRVASFDGDYDDGSFQDGSNTYTNELINPSLAVDYTKDKWTYAGRYNLAASERIFTSAFGEFVGKGQAHQGELFAVLDPNNGGSLTFGAQLRNEILILDSPDMDDPTATTISPYAQYSLVTKGGFLLDAGARFNNHSEFGGQLNWSLGAGMQTTDSWSTRLNVGSAFLSPTLDQLAGPFGANPDLKPQVSTSAELSTQLVDPAGKYSIAITGFQRNIKDVVTFDFAAGYQNQGELLDTGVEVEGAVAIGKAFRLDGNLTYVQGKLTSSDGNGGTVESKDFPRRPQTSGALGLTFQPRSPFMARISSVFIGARPDVFFDANFTQMNVDLDAYTLVNAYAEYKFLKQRNLTAFAELRNLTDANFVEVTGFSTQGTTIRVGVKVVL
ncbi:MAG: vitamin B12 transporter [Neolewinella sp.]